MNDVRRREDVKKFRAMIIALVLLSLPCLLFSASIGEPVVLRLHAYIPERTVFLATDDGLVVESNAYNFTYSMVEQGWERVVMVVAT